MMVSGYPEAWKKAKGYAANRARAARAAPVPSSRAKMR